MLTWICPLCGRECQENEAECFGCNPDAVLVAAASPSTSQNEALAEHPQMSGSALATAIAEPPHWHDHPPSNPWSAAPTAPSGESTYERALEALAETPTLNLPVSRTTGHDDPPSSHLDPSITLPPPPQAHDWESALTAPSAQEAGLHPGDTGEVPAPPATPHLQELAGAVQQAPAYVEPEPIAPPATAQATPPVAWTASPVLAEPVAQPLAHTPVSEPPVLEALAIPAPAEFHAEPPAPTTDEPAVAMPASLVEPPPVPVAQPEIVAEAAPSTVVEIETEPVAQLVPQTPSPAPVAPPSFNWLDQAVADELPTAKIDRPRLSERELQTPQVHTVAVPEAADPGVTADFAPSVLPQPQSATGSPWHALAADLTATPESAVPPVPTVAEPPAMPSLASNLDFETMEMQIPSQDFLDKHFGPGLVPPSVATPAEPAAWSPGETWTAPSWQQELASEPDTTTPAPREGQPPFSEWFVPTPAAHATPASPAVETPSAIDDTQAWSLPAFGDDAPAFSTPTPVPPAGDVQPSAAHASSYASVEPPPLAPPVDPGYELSPVELADASADMLSTQAPDDDWDRLMADLSTAEYEARWGVQATGTHAVASDNERTAQHRLVDPSAVPPTPEPAADSPFSLDYPLTGEGERTQQFRLPSTIEPAEPPAAPSSVDDAPMETPAFSQAAADAHWTASLELADPLSQTIQAPQMNLPPVPVNLYDAPAASLTPDWGAPPPAFGTPAHPLEDWSTAAMPEPPPPPGPSFLGGTPAPAAASMDHWGHKAFPTEEPAFSGPADLGPAAVKDRDLLSVPLPADHWSLKKSDTLSDADHVPYVRTGAHAVPSAVNLDAAPITPDMPSNQTPIPTIPPPVAVAPRRNTFGMVAMLLIGLLLAGGVAMFLGSKLGGGSPSPQQAGLPTAAVPINSHPLSKYLEIVGFRVVPGPGITGQVKFIVVNHSKGPVSNANLEIVLKSLTNASEPETATRFKVSLPQLGAEESTEITASVQLNNTVNTATWQNLRPEFSIY